MTITFDSLFADDNWVPMSLDQQNNPKYFWNDGGLLADAPVDFKATFDGAMWTTASAIDVPSFNRNPLRVRPDFVVPRHHHNMDEMIFVFKGQYTVEYLKDGEWERRRVGPGQMWVSRAGTPYTMFAGPEGVTYIETWPKPVTTLETYWYDFGWIRR